MLVAAAAEIKRVPISRAGIRPQCTECGSGKMAVHGARLKSAAVVYSTLINDHNYSVSTRRNYRSHVRVDQQQCELLRLGEKKKRLGSLRNALSYVHRCFAFVSNAISVAIFWVLEHLKQCL